MHDSNNDLGVPAMSGRLTRWVRRTTGWPTGWAFHRVFGRTGFGDYSLTTTNISRIALHASANGWVMAPFELGHVDEHGDNWRLVIDEAEATLSAAGEQYVGTVASVPGTTHPVDVFAFVHGEGDDAISDPSCTELQLAVDDDEEAALLGLAVIDRFALALEQIPPPGP